jgi:hypothetical protein
MKYGMVLMVAATGAAWASAQGGRIDPAQRQKVVDAVPERARVVPARDRKLLVFTLCKGFRHSSIPLGAAALELMGRKTGAYEAVVSDDPAMFSPAKIKRFDAICFLSTTGELFDDEKLKASLLEFVRGGKGVIGIHAATDCFYKWADFGEMMGGYFDGHPWHEKVTIKIEQPGHPVCAAFDGPRFEIVDEIYQLRAPYSRDKLRVLVSLDTQLTNMDKRGVKRSDGDFAVSWVRSYGKGRVFYCSLGHREEIFWNPTILRHYLDGIQFALGDLPAETTPSGRSEEKEWAQLFNGRDLAGWRAPPGAWVVEDGVLARRGRGDIWTEDRYGDFILELEFKISEQGNSGIFFRTGEIGDPVQTGIELQVLDSYGKETVGKHDCGAIYDCLAPRKNAVKKAGEWNRVLLTCKGARIEVEMNGVRIVEMNLDEWSEPRRNPDGTRNKFRTAYKDMPRRGFIGFQNHGTAVSYRNVRIKQLAE